MGNRYVFWVLFLILATSPCAFAQSGLSAADQEALQKTLELLRSPEKRQEAAKGDSGAQKVEGHVQKLAGDKTEDVFELAARVFEKMVIKYGGDVDQMKAALEKAQSDPKGFAASEFSEEELKALRELSSKLPQSPKSH